MTTTPAQSVRAEGLSCFLLQSSLQGAQLVRMLLYQDLQSLSIAVIKNGSAAATGFIDELFETGGAVSSSKRNAIEGCSGQQPIS